MLVGVLACAGPLSPVLYGLGERMLDGRFVNPPIFWRSSPRGSRPARLRGSPIPITRSCAASTTRSRRAPTDFVEYTAALSLVALAVIAVAVWRAGYRPRAGWIWLTAGFAALSLGPFVYIAGINTYVPGPWALLRYVAADWRGAHADALRGRRGAGSRGPLRRRTRSPRQNNIRSGVRSSAAAIGGVLLFELMPAPRTLYSAEIPSLYRTIAADPRPVRIVELPFGVRDGLSAAGNFSSHYQYYQTLHGKRLMGGYLSRISKKRLEEVRSQPTLDALLTFSEGGQLSPEHEARIKARAPIFLARSNLGYVVINHVLAPKRLVDFVTEAWGLQEVERHGPRVLYRPTVVPAGN